MHLSNKKHFQNFSLEKEEDPSLSSTFLSNKPTWDKPTLKKKAYLYFRLVSKEKKREKIQKRKRTHYCQDQNYLCVASTYERLNKADFIKGSSNLGCEFDQTKLAYIHNSCRLVGYSFHGDPVTSYDN